MSRQQHSRQVSPRLAEILIQRAGDPSALAAQAALQHRSRLHLYTRITCLVELGGLNMSQSISRGKCWQRQQLQSPKKASKWRCKAPACLFRTSGIKHLPRLRNIEHSILCLCAAVLISGRSQPTDSGSERGSSTRGWSDGRSSPTDSLDSLTASFDSLAGDGRFTITTVLKHILASFCKMQNTILMTLSCQFPTW